MGHKLQKEQVKVYGNVWRENMEGEKIIQLCYTPKNKS